MSSIKALSVSEAELRYDEYQGFEEGKLRFAKMNDEYQKLLDSRFLKFEKPRRERVLNSDFTEVTNCSARFGIITIFQCFVTRTNWREMPIYRIGGGGGGEISERFSVNKYSKI